MKKVSNTETELKKTIAYKKACILLHLRQTNILCYEVFERNEVIETSPALFLKKSRLVIQSTARM